MTFRYLMVVVIVMVMTVVTVLSSDTGSAAASADAAVGRVAFAFVVTRSATFALDGENDDKHYLW
jgi:hypothetical protein